MNLDDLAVQWKRLDEKLDRTLAIESELLRHVVERPARRRVARLTVWPALDVAFAASVLAFAAPFLANHWHEARLAVPAAVTFAGALALLIDAIRQIERLATLDWAGPVAAIQHALERVRLAKVRQFKWVMLFAPLVGFCGFVTGVHGLLAWLSDGRADFLSKLDSRWIVANYAFGVAFPLVGATVARWLAAKCGHRRWWRYVLDGISGTSLAAATKDVDRWATLCRN